MGIKKAHEEWIMAIKKIKVTNFKSFKELEVELGDLNILIGANAAGKSNFVDIFRFLRDIENSSLSNAIFERSGFENLRNLKAELGEPLSLEVVSEREFQIRVARVVIEIYETTYKCSIEPRDGEPRFQVGEDNLRHKCKFHRLDESGKIKKEDIYGEGEIIVSHTNGKVTVEPKIDESVSISQEDIFPPGSRDLSSRSAVLGSNTRFFQFSPSPSDKIFGDIAAYDLIPNYYGIFARNSAEAELHEDGSNLAVVLKRIMETEDGKRKLLNLVTYLLPFVVDLDVGQNIDKALFTMSRERYFERFLPPRLISGGTMNMIALIVALYFEENPVAIIEEPGRGIHPYLMSGVIDMMRDASENKQIIATTHNPEMVRYADKKDILLISRDDEGFSSICRPVEKEDVKAFLEKEDGFRMEDLYVNDLLEL